MNAFPLNVPAPGGSVGVENHWSPTPSAKNECNLTSDRAIAASLSGRTYSCHAYGSYGYPA